MKTSSGFITLLGVAAFILARCSSGTSSGASDASVNGDTDACAAYCQKELECAADWFDDFFGTMEKCTDNCVEGKDISAVLACTLECDNNLPCEDWLACETTCYDTGGGDADADADGDADVEPSGFCAGHDSEKTYDGDFTLKNSNDLEAFADYTCITGNLELDASALTSLALADLEAVGGNLSIQHTPLESLELGALKKVGDNLHIILNTALASVDLGSLAEVAAFINVFSNDALTELRLPSFTKAGWALFIYSNDSLLSITADSLETSDGKLEIHSHRKLSEISMSALRSVGANLSIYDNSTLPTCAAIDLRDQVPNTGSVCIRGNLADNCDDDTSGCEEP